MSSDSLFGRIPLIVSAACWLIGCGGMNGPEATGTENEGGSGGNLDDGSGGTSPQGSGGAGVGGPTSPQGGRGGVSAAVDAGTSLDAKASPMDAAAPRDVGAGSSVDLSLYRPVVAAYGYGGLRTFSFDGGRTWPYKVLPYPGGGDDENLIRGMAYNNGTWIAAGWKVFISRDGAKTWSEISERAVPGGWYDCVNFKNGKWIAKNIRGGQGGEVISSVDDGATWKTDSSSTTCNPVLPNPPPLKQPSGDDVFGMTQGMAIP